MELENPNDTLDEGLYFWSSSCWIDNYWLLFRMEHKQTFMKIMSNGYVAGILGAIFAHVIADLIASLIDPQIRFATIGIVLGGITPLVFIPFLERYVVKSKHHIVVGDHEDIEKDLKSH